MIKKIVIPIGIFLLTGLAGCCLTCPAQQPRFTQPCEELMYEAGTQGITVIQRGDTLRMILPADTFFYPASSELNEDNIPALSTVAELAQCYCYSCMPMRITGYTDNMGTIKQQKALGLRRAEKIAEVLSAEGVPYERMTIRSFGARGTLSSNATPGGEADNRRVEITIP